MTESMENGNDDCELSTIKSELNHSSTAWKHGLEKHQFQVVKVEEKLEEVKTSISTSEEDSKRELELLGGRVKTFATMLTYLKSKARILAVPHLAHTSCGIKHQDGVGYVDKHGVPLSDWPKDIDFSSFESPSDQMQLANSPQLSSSEVNNGDYIDDILKSVRIVTDVMESLVKRVIIAENEAANEKEKVRLGLEENQKKVLQIESMSAKVEEMEKFALGTNSILNEMRQKVEDMVEETSRQRQRAAENEQELRRVKQDFESLRSFVSSLISVRETLVSSERQFQTLERLFDKLIVKSSHLENERDQKEAEVQKLIVENVGLRALLDKKEAQLLAMNEQCKYMALNASGM